MTPQPQDPAERSGYLRHFYRDWRPTRLGRLWSAAFAWVAGLGILPDLLVSLAVNERESGRLNRVVLVAVTYQGRRYLVSMLGGGSQWVRNVRAAGGAAFVKRGRLRPVMLTELPPEDRAPVLKAWCQVASSGRRHLPVPHDAPEAAFAAIAADYPVFRVDPMPTEAAAKRA
jgi:hypothetical protein